MGQRTCIVVRQKNFNKYQNKWEESTYVFHDQWGIGKCLPMDCVALFLDAYRKCGLDLISTHDPLNTAVAYGKAWNITGDYGHTWQEAQEFLNSIDFHDMKQVKDFIDNHHDNNNGGVYIEIVCPDYDNMRISYAFFSGCEEEKNGKYCDKPLTYKQWMNNWKEYKNVDFDNVWASVSKYCNVEPFVSKKGKLVSKSVFIMEQLKDTLKDSEQ